LYCLVHNIWKLANYGQLVALCEPIRPLEIALKRLWVELCEGSFYRLIGWHRSRTSDGQ
jgi:hypothetical protein